MLAEQDTCITNKYYNMTDSVFMEYKNLAHNNNLDVNEFSQYVLDTVWALCSWSDYTKAQELLKQAYDLVHNYARNSPNALRTIEYSMGYVQFHLSDLPGSIKHFLKAKRMFEREKDYTSNYLNCMIFLQKSFLAKGQVGYAKILLDECIKINELILSANKGISKEIYDLTKAQIASEYLFMGYSKTAQEHLEELFSKYGESVVGPNWDDARLILAHIYIKNKEYMKACNLMDKSLHSPSTAENALAAVQANTIALTLAKSEHAPGFIQATCDYIRKKISELLPKFTEELDRESFWNKEINEISNISYLALNSLSEFNIPQDADFATKLQVFGKPDFASVCTNAYNTAIYVKSRQERGIHPTPDWKDIQNMLCENEAAVEFIVSEDTLQAVHYAALVLRKDAEKPDYVELCTASDLDDIWRDVIHTDTALINRLYGQHDTQLYNLLWKKLELLLNKVDVIYYSPAGFISRMNLGAISNGKERMEQKYRLHRLSSTSEIKNIKQRKPINAGKAVIYGGLDYNASREEMLQAARPYEKLSSTTKQASLLANHISASRGDTRGAVDMLTGTLQEAYAVSSILQSAGFETQTVTGINGNEESLKALSGHAPTVLHLATHGFFLSSTIDQRSHLSLLESLSTTSSPLQNQAMLYTGLLMSGANHAWTSGISASDRLEDGIVTAFELSQIDLTGCKLVVLSACETGIGVSSSDNAYEFNIPYALKLANAGTVVASLWEVPDEATSLLMEHFYQGITNGKQPNDALLAAQEIARRVYPQPYYWAAFYVID